MSAEARLVGVSARQRIEALADGGAIASVDRALDASRASAYLARWSIRAQDDDGIVVARASVHGTAVWFAAQDERFLGGSIGEGHARALHELLAAALRERRAVVLLLASGGVRLHERHRPRSRSRAPWRRSSSAVRRAFRSSRSPSATCSASRRCSRAPATAPPCCRARGSVSPGRRSSRRRAPRRTSARKCSRRRHATPRVRWTSWPMRPTRCAVGSSRRSFTNALQAPRLFVVTGARVMAMGTQAAASVTGLDHDAFARDDDRALGQGIAALAQSRTLEAELPELDEAALRAVLR